MARSYKERIDNLYNKIITVKNFDISTFIFSLEKQVQAFVFFHNVLGKNANNREEASKIKYDLKKGLKPLEGQVAYINLGFGYPKELYDGHWCYILKDCDSEMIIIPTTSIKESKKEINEKYEMEITIKDFCEEGNSRLRINQMRSIDIMRISKEKGIYDVSTDIDDIKKKVSKILNISVDK